MRYDQGNYMNVNKQSHHHHPPMHTAMNENFAMRYQPISTNLANLVTQNIQQRFGTG